ncbi:SDR family NAD(P)-dependent oxidoreductase [Vibrio chagasii]|nr:SDR family NAD(P)-dependent oxidoreductase [Vibrio chagasii]
MLNDGTQHQVLSSTSAQSRVRKHSQAAAYCGTKFAVHAISENVREEVAASNVRVTTIAPGAVETELLSHTTSQRDQRRLRFLERNLSTCIGS